MDSNETKQINTYKKSEDKDFNLITKSSIIINQQDINNFPHSQLSWW